MRVAINACLTDVGSGGVQQVILSMAEGFKDLNESDIERIWIVYKGTTWWRKSLPAGDDRIEISPPFGKLGLLLGQHFPNFTSYVRPYLSRLLPESSTITRILSERKVDLVHFPFQDAFKTNLPSVYNPHDFQQKYFPGYFTQAQLNHRKYIWREYAKSSKFIITETLQVARDARDEWGIDPAKLVVLPSPPPNLVELKNVIRSRNGTDIFYPSGFWPHKNHERLIDAFKILKKSGFPGKLILPGFKIGEYAKLQDLVNSLGLSKDVTFLGHISRESLITLFAECKILVVPTLFESISLPVWEGMAARIPIAASEVCGIPDQLGGTGVTFNPENVEDIAEKLFELWRNPEVSENLTAQAFKRVENLRALDFALALQGVYRESIGTKPNPEELVARGILSGLVMAK